MLRPSASPAFTHSNSVGCWAGRGKGKNHPRTRGRGRWGNEKGSEKFQLRKKKPFWKIQKEGKGYLEHTGEHETGEDSVGKETKKKQKGGDEPRGTSIREEGGGGEQG